MATIRAGLYPFKGCSCRSALQWQRQLQSRLPSRSITTEVRSDSEAYPPPPPTTAQMPSSLTGFSETDSSSSAKETKGGQNTFSWGEMQDMAEGGGKPQGNLRLTGPTDARPFPVSPSYFSRQSQFMDDYVRIQEMFRKYSNLPLAKPENVRQTSWKKLKDYQAACGEKIKAIDYSRCLGMVKHLHKIHADLRPKRLDPALDRFKRVVDAFVNEPTPIRIDRFGRALAVGKRKTSVARVWVVEGTGEVQVNGKMLSDAFHRVHDRESATWALRATDRSDKYNMWVLVGGGGTTGQAEAVNQAVAKALMAHEPALKPALRRAGCITRDPRVVERKKPGHVKARKMPAWVKR